MHFACFCASRRIEWLLSGCAQSLLRSCRHRHPTCAFSTGLRGSTNRTPPTGSASHPLTRLDFYLSSFFPLYPRRQININSAFFWLGGVPKFLHLIAPYTYKIFLGVVLQKIGEAKVHPPFVNLTFMLKQIVKLPVIMVIGVCIKRCFENIWERGSYCLGGPRDLLLRIMYLQTFKGEKDMVSCYDFQKFWSNRRPQWRILCRGICKSKGLVGSLSVNKAILSTILSQIPHECRTCCATVLQVTPAVPFLALHLPDKNGLTPTQ